MRNDDKDTKYIFHRGSSSILLLFCHEDSKNCVNDRMSIFKFSEGYLFHKGLQNVGVLYLIITRSKDFDVNENVAMGSRQITLT